MSFIPKTSKFYFYDNCRYTQIQVFYNLPYISNLILNEFQVNIAKYDYKLCFMPSYKKGYGMVSELLSTANFHLIPSIHSIYSSLNHLGYNKLVKEYYYNKINILAKILSSNAHIIHFLYSSKLLNYTIYGQSNKDYTECMQSVTSYLNRFIYSFIAFMHHLWVQLQIFISNIYASYCSCILNIMLNSSNGSIFPLPISTNFNQNLL